MTDLTPRRVLLTAALGFLTLEPCEPERRVRSQRHENESRGMTGNASRLRSPACLD